MSKQTPTTYATKTFSALAAVGLLATAGTTHASFQISTAQQDKESAADFTGDAFDAESNFLDQLDSSKTEDFEDGYSHNQNSPSTPVGDFVRGPDAVDGDGNACTDQCEEPNVFDETKDVSDSGRYDVTGESSDFYLDSNDVTQVEWQVDASLGGAASANSLGFFLTDPGDEGATFEISTADETEIFNIGPSQENGELFYISAISNDGPITGASVFFENQDDTQADGFGIDNATVGVPTPGTLAMLGTGLLGFGLIGRRRGRRSAD